VDSVQRDSDPSNGEWTDSGDEFRYYPTDTGPGPSAEDLDAAAAMFAGDDQGDDDLGDISSGLLMAAGWPRTRAELELRMLGVMSCRMADVISRTRDSHNLDS
jgi:hypothetical protein